MGTPPNSTTAHARVVSRAWTDPAYRNRLTTDTHAALAEEGINVPAGMQVKVLQNTPTLQHLVLPVAPGAGAATAGDGIPSSALGIIGGASDGIIGSKTGDGTIGPSQGTIGPSGGTIGPSQGTIGPTGGTIGGGKTGGDGIIGGGTNKPKS